MADHVQHPHLLRRGGGGLVDQQQRLAVGDAAQVLHSAEGEVRDRHHVHLAPRVRDAVVGSQVLEAEAARFQGVTRQMRLAFGRCDAERNPAGVHRFGGLEGADHESHQVGGHDHGVGEGHGGLPPAGGRPPGLGAVRQCRQAVRHHQGYTETGLEVGLVPAGESPPGVCGLELGGGDDLLPPVRVGEGRTVETPQLIVEHPAEAAVKLPSALRQRPGQIEDGALLLLAVLHLGVHPHAAGPGEPGLVDLQLGGVQHHPADGFRHFQSHRRLPREARLLQVRLEAEPIMAGDRIARQPVGVVGHVISIASDNCQGGVIQYDPPV